MPRDIEKVCREQVAGFGEQEARSPGIVEQETEPFLPYAAGGM